MKISGKEFRRIVCTHEHCTITPCKLFLRKEGNTCIWKYNASKDCCIMVKYDYENKFVNFNEIEKEDVEYLMCIIIEKRLVG